MIPRRLEQEQANSDVVIVDQNALPSLAGPIVILGEAGAGKTRLLEWLANSAGYPFCTARRLITTPEPSRLLNDTQTLVIDALDELNTSREGQSVDLVVEQLAKTDYPRFILSCRVADWRSASSTSLIKEHYGTPVTELHLLPFDEDEALHFLSTHFGATEADRIQRHLTKRGLGALLGNPQTLQMVAEVARFGALPESRGELFEKALTLLSREHRNEKAEQQLPQADALDTAGAVCAALLLSGCEAITRRAPIQGQADLPISELVRLTERSALNAVLDTRLFVAAGADRFTYLHRSIAEFLGACWLAQKCTSDRQRRRLLANLQGYGGVPSALRGIHAWLANVPSLTESVIRADPMGFIEYGDPSSLSLNHTRVLLDSLRQLADRNPDFLPWKDFRVPAFLQSGLQAEIQELIATKATSFGLRMLLLQALRDAKPDSPFIPELRRIALDSTEWFAARSMAGEALVVIVPDEDWPRFIDQLCELADDDSIRLALELMKRLGYALFTDQQIVSVVCAQTRAEHRVVGPLFMLKRDLPIERIDGVLDLLAEELGPFDDIRDGMNEAASALTDFAYHLLARRLKAGSVEARQLWRWLNPYAGSDGYQDDDRTAINDYLRGHTEIRQAIQAITILQKPVSNDPWRSVCEISRRAAGLAVSEPDVVALLGALDPLQTTDKLWKSIVQLVHHDATAGAAVRTAARRFAASDTEQLAWIDSLTHRVKPQWQIESEARERERRAERTQRLTEVRASYAPCTDQMRAGEVDSLIGPAQAYFGRFREYQSEDPVERLTEMLGEELCSAALNGFETTLQRPDQFPTAKEIADSLADNKILNASFVLAAGLAERTRRNLGFDDLEDDCVLKGFIAIYATAFSSDQKLVDAVAACALERGLWKQGIQLRVEPQFNGLDKSVYELYDVMRDEAMSRQGTELALEWLRRFPVLPVTAEMEIIDRLIASGEVDPLRRAWQSRCQSADPVRRRLWLAVGLLIDFDRAAESLVPTMIEPELLWDLRARLEKERKGADTITLAPVQAAWIISTFRSRWPRTPHPSGGWTGNTNPWDANEFIDGVISQLGNDLSDDARDTLHQLHNAPADDYTERIKIAMAEQQQALIESSYRPLTLGAIEAIVTEKMPTTIKDLQAFMLEELAVVQRKIKSDDADSWRGFFDDNNQPHDEERCRDHLLSLLRQGAEGIHLEPETHVALDKRVDITCRVNGSSENLRLPIEIKGQWHSNLWTAADQQLDRLYATDWQAQHHGIYLVLWFGVGVAKSTKQLRRPPRDQDRPTTPYELRSTLHAQSTAALQGRIEIFVLDLERTQNH